MKTIQVNLYEFSELTPEAQEKALNDWNATNDMPMLKDDLTEWLRGALPEKGIEGDPAVMYSLGHSQGDGAMFEGSFMYKGVSIVVKHSGHYYHENSKNMDFDYEGLSDTDTLKTDDKEQAAFKGEFDNLYTDLCRKMAKVGYEVRPLLRTLALIEYEEEANEYTFEADGTIRNA